MLFRSVAEVLGALGIDPADGSRLIEVWNKIDRLSPDGLVQMQNLAKRSPTEQTPILVSALTGEGVDALYRAIEGRLSKRRIVLSLLLDPADGAGVSWLYRNAEVMEKSMDDDGKLAMTVRVDPAKAEMVKSKFAEIGRAHV